MLADYQSHSDETLWYMNQALYWINKLKEIFWHFCSRNENDREYFNFFKFHAIIHYSEFICKYESADEIDSSHFKILYRHFVKKFFACINKKDDFQKQIFQHNSHCINIQMIKSILLYILTKKRNQIKETIKIQMTCSIQTVNLQQIE